jgi:hypothetical protein
MSKKLINVTKGAAAAREMASMEKQAKSQRPGTKQGDRKNPTLTKKGAIVGSSKGAGG